MFMLRDLPSREVLAKFQKTYSEIDVDAILVFLNIMRLGSDYMNWLDGFLKPYHLKHGRLMTLFLLLREGGTGQAALLAKAQGVSKPTMTNLISSLEKSKLVAVRQDSQDGRRSNISITKKGEAMLDELIPQYYQEVSKLCSKLSKNDKETLLSGFLCLNHTMETVLNSQK